VSKAWRSSGSGAFRPSPLVIVTTCSAAAERKPWWRGWADGVRAYGQIRRHAVLGFSSGLPFLLVFSTLSMVRESGIERATIGMLSWVGIIYDQVLLGAGRRSIEAARPASPARPAARLDARGPGWHRDRAAEHGEPAPGAGTSRSSRRSRC
jgi:hypothetical protein